MIPRRLLHVFSTFAVGGPQRRFATVARELGPDITHYILAMDGRYDAEALLDGSERVSWRRLHQAMAKGRFLPNLPRAGRMLRTVRPDLLVTYNWGAMEFALANRLLGLVGQGVRGVHIEDGFGPEEANGQITRRVRLRRLALDSDQVTLVVPSLTLAAVAEQGWRLKHRVLYLPNGIDCDRYAAPRIADSGRNRPPIRIGTIAMLRPEKNLMRLLDAFAALAPTRPVSLRIVGDGPERPRLEARARALDLGDRVEFTGPTATPEQALADLDIFALSSDTEQMPLSVLEAMASGLPIASVDVGDVARMVARPNQPYVVPRDAAALAQALQALVDEPDTRFRVGAANRAQAVSTFSLARMIEGYQALFA